MSELQQYAWTMTGMRQLKTDESTNMHYYRGLETDRYIDQLQRALRAQIKQTFPSVHDEETLNKLYREVMKNAQ